jgi:hypothetical protein
LASIAADIAGFAAADGRQKKRVFYEIMREQEPSIDERVQDYMVPGLGHKGISARQATL